VYFYARTNPRAAANKAKMELAARLLALLAGADVLGDVFAEVAVPAGEEAEPVPDEVARGTPVYAVAPVGMGPTPAEADAPSPTNPPSPWPGVFPKLFAADWKAANVFPLAGALIAPTIPEEQ